jgi:hypothetical protein
VSPTYSLTLVDALIVIVVVLVGALAYQFIINMSDRQLALFAVWFSFMAMIIGIISILKFYQIQAEYRPWISIGTKMVMEASGILKMWRRYGAPTLELIKGFGIFKKFIGKVTGKKVDLPKYVRTRKKARKAPARAPVPKAQVWRRSQVVLNEEDLVRPQNRV